MNVVLKYYSLNSSIRFSQHSEEPMADIRDRWFLPCLADVVNHLKVALFAEAEQLRWSKAPLPFWEVFPTRTWTEENDDRK